MLEFGERVDGYAVRVVNEREVRAGAGLLLVPALIAFFSACSTGDFTLARMVILAFAVDFSIRVFVSPRFAPSLVLARYLVRKQQPEYSGAPQKRFAWSLGLVIASFMLVWTTGFNLAGPVAVLGCLTCIVLLWSESVLGVCIGCTLYNLVHRERAQHCPGGSCEVEPRSASGRVNFWQVSVAVPLLIGLAAAVPVVAGLDQPGVGPDRADSALTPSAECEVPDFARALGHEELWRRHNGCA